MSVINGIKDSILKVLKNDSRPMPLQVLMHKVCQDQKLKKPDIFIQKKDFNSALKELMSSYLVGKNKFNKYFIDYLDYEELDTGGEGFLEIDHETGNGYITIKTDPKEYKKSTHFVHKKNLNGAKTGDFVEFKELKITSKNILKFPLIDSRIKRIISRN